MLLGFAELLGPIVEGMLIGSVFGLMAIGLSFILGVAGFVNVAQADFATLSMYLTFGLFAILSLNPALSSVIGFAAFFFLGYLLYKTLFVRVIAHDEFSQMVFTAALSLFIQNVMQIVVGERLFRLQFLQQVVRIGEVSVDLSRVVALTGAIAIAIPLSLFLNRTKLGTGLRAVKEDAFAARTLGVDIGKVRSVAFGIGLGTSAAAGSLLALNYPIFPQAGLTFILFMFTVTLLGGTGNIFGTMIAGIVIGITRSLTGEFFGFVLRDLGVYIIFLLVLSIKKEGLLGYERRTI